MRKLKRGRKLSRKAGPRKILLKSLVNSFVLLEKIKTTEAKAKEMKPLVEKIITKAKADTVSNRRILSGYLTPKALKKIFEQIGPQQKERKGGYARIIKLGPRISDGAKMVIIELVK